MFVMYFCFTVTVVMLFITIYDVYKNDDRWKYSAFACMFNLMLAIYNGVHIIITSLSI